MASAKGLGCLAVLALGAVILTVGRCADEGPPLPTHAETQAKYEEALARLNTPLVLGTGLAALQSAGVDCQRVEQIRPRYWLESDLDQATRYELIVTCSDGAEYNVEMDRDGRRPRVSKRAA